VEFSSGVGLVSTPIAAGEHSYLFLTLLVRDFDAPFECLVKKKRFASVESYPIQRLFTSQHCHVALEIIYCNDTMSERRSPVATVTTLGNTFESKKKLAAFKIHRHLALDP